MRYTYVRQHDTTDCAAACLAMVCLHYKKEVTITRLRDMMGTDLKGTNLVGLQKAANELGFTTAAVRVDRENFLSDFSLPCIAQVITDQGLAHFVVVFKKTTIKDDGARRKHMLQDAEARKEEEEKGKKHKCKDYVIIGDPGTELKKISLDEFYKNFTGVLLLLNPTSEFKGGKIEKGGMMKRYINLLLPQKKLFFYAILSSVITTILGIASSMFNKILMDEVLPYGLNSLLVTLILVFSVVSITSTLIGFVRQWVLIHLSIKIDIPLMLGYFGHIFNLPMKFFATRKTGDITTRYSDANTIKSIFTSIALSLVMDISMAIITGIILFRMNAMLFSISLFMALVSILLVLVYKQPYKKINEESMAQSAALNSQMIESLRGIETVKCNANEQTELDNLEREYMKSLKISLRSSRISTTQGLISSFISTGFSMLTTYVGISQVLNGEMTLGGFMAFSTLSGYFTSPLSNLIGLQMQIQEASISMKRLTEIMDYPAEYETADGVEQSELDKVEGDIEFKDVTFRYGNRAPALDHVSFTIPAGKNSATFSVTMASSGDTTVQATYDGKTSSVTIEGLDPSIPIQVAGFAPASLVLKSGEAKTVTLSLNKAAKTATTVSLSSSHADITVPATVGLAIGEQTVTFDVTASAGATDGTTANITAKIGTTPAQTLAVSVLNSVATTETFDGIGSGNTSYVDASFTSTATGLTWAYKAGRTGLDVYAIDGEGIMFNEATKKAGSISTTLTTGVQSIEVQAKKAFTGNGDRIVTLKLNGTQCGSLKLTTDDTETLKCADVNLSGAVEVLIESTGKQTTIDNVTWLSF